MTHRSECTVVIHMYVHHLLRGWFPPITLYSIFHQYHCHPPYIDIKCLIFENYLWKKQENVNFTFTRFLLVRSDHSNCIKRETLAVNTKKKVCTFTYRKSVYWFFHFYSAWYVEVKCNICCDRGKKQRDYTFIPTSLFREWAIMKQACRVKV